MRLIIMGPPGAGKGTQAKYIGRRLSVPAISTGDIFRDNVSRGTTLGREAERYMAAGEYVPDEVTNGMVRARLGEPDAMHGFLLDGYPRTLSQVADLDEMLGSAGRRLDAVLTLTVGAGELAERLLQRAEIEGRADDTEAIIRRRQEVYVEQTAPLLDVYEQRGLLVRVDGRGTVDEITTRIFQALTVSSEGSANITADTRM